MTKRTLSTNNHVENAFKHFSKPYLNTLSPGCVSCARGTWACVYINQVCSRHCFFCLREQREPEDFAPYADRHMRFDSPQRLIEYLRLFDCEGVGFSGGEPFLAYDRLLRYISAIRDAFGHEHYVWVYTNGDPVTKEKLIRLADIGLDEIRFDISARDYDLSPISLALDHVARVTVEIPAIPEDVDRVMSFLPQLESMGVRYVNVHQLMMNDYNRDLFEPRGYTALHEDRYHEWFPILESESAALEILNRAERSDMGLGINYCGLLYKRLFQGRGFRRRYARLCRSDDEEVTSTGYLRRVTRPGGSDAHDGPIDLLEPEGEPIKVTYFSPSLLAETHESIPDSCTTHLEAFRACLGKEPAAEFELANLTAKLFFQLLFIEQYDIETACSQVSALFEMEPDKRGAVLAELKEFHRRFHVYEYIPDWIPSWKNP